MDDIKTYPLPLTTGKEKLLKRLSKRTFELCQLAEKSTTTAKFKALDRENELDVFLLYDLSKDDVEIIDSYFDELSVEV